MKTPDEIADFVIGLYMHYGGDDYIGEPVSQLEHMCQCAVLAENEGCSDEIILAAFLHDIGHLCEHIMPVQYMDGLGVVDHEKLGADFLRENLFSEVVASLVENHVQAKRYLTLRDEAYYQQLSEASRKTLDFQGGRMSSAEATVFESDPLFDFHIRLRKWDERAKEEAQLLPPLEKYRNMIFEHIRKNTSHAN